MLPYRAFHTFPPSRDCLSNPRCAVIIHQGLFPANIMLVFYHSFHMQFTAFVRLRIIQWNMKAAKSEGNRHKRKMKLSQSYRGNTTFSFMPLLCTKRKNKYWNINCILKNKASCSNTEDGFNKCQMLLKEFWYFSVGGILYFIPNILLGVLHTYASSPQGSLKTQKKKSF